MEGLKPANEKSISSQQRYARAGHYFLNIFLREALRPLEKVVVSVIALT
jgi:hypothetical protein